MAKAAARDISEYRHPIQLVARRTGLSPDVIRVWERRYKVVMPYRASQQRRLYSDTDIERLQLLQRATVAGRRISDVAKLSDEDLAKLVATDGYAAVEASGRTYVRPTTGVVMEHFDECLEAVHAINPRALTSALSKAVTSLSVRFLLEELLNPLLLHIADECRQGNMQRCQEQMANAFIRSFLGSLMTDSNEVDESDNVIVTTPVGQLHEMATLMLAVLVSAENWEPVYLGPNLSATEITYACVQAGAVAVLLGIDDHHQDPHLPNELRNLSRELPEQVPMICGGDAVNEYVGVLNEIGATIVKNMDELITELERYRRPD